jgi:hypothetical protein
MAMKTFKRTIIIRERDLLDLMRTTIKKSLFDRIDVEPLTYQEIQNEILVNTLKGEQPTRRYSTLPDVYETLMYKEGNLYNKNYLNWFLTMDYPAGQIYVQSRTTEPREPLHRVTFEKDYA